MGHIGNTVQTAFTSFDKQTITGSGTAVYTLSHSVSNEQEIEVFVNNVRQEGGSGKAYTVSGNQITFTENIASTDTVYVNFAGKAVQTVTHPSDAPLQATTGTFSSNVDVGGSLLVDTIKEGTGTNTAMTIDSSGRILTPARPAFKVTTATIQNISSTVYAKMQWTNTAFDIGSDFDLTNNEFVVPVNGIYNISTLVRGTGTQGTLDMMTVRLDIANSSGTTLYEVDLIQMHPMANQLENSHLGGSTLLALNVGERVSVEVRIDGSALTIGSGSGQFNWFCGHLVG